MGVQDPGSQWVFTVYDCLRVHWLIFRKGILFLYNRKRSLEISVWAVSTVSYVYCKFSGMVLKKNLPALAAVSDASWGPGSGAN